MLQEVRSVKIALLESLGVDEAFIDDQAKKLEGLGHELNVYDKNSNPEIQAIQTKDADAIILANMPLSEKAVKEAEQLKFIDVAFTGVDHIPVKLAKEKGIAISNASGYATEAVAELCMGFIFDMLRQVKQTEKSLREGGTKAGFEGNLLQSKTVGLVGAGAIGKLLAKYLKAFGVRVIAYNRSKIEDENIDEQLPLKDVLRQSDIVSLHVPLTEETKNLIGKDELALMKKSAFLINTARGGVVDEKALAEALKNNDIAGAAVDVFKVEPPLPEDAPLLDAPNAILTPHIAFYSKESMEKRAQIVFDNLYSWLEGKPKNII